MSNVLLSSCTVTTGRSSLVFSRVPTAGWGSSNIVLKNGEATVRNTLKTWKSIPSEDRIIMSAFGWSKGGDAQVDIIGGDCGVVLSIRRNEI
jgi:hypothetical protein